MLHVEKLRKSFNREPVIKDVSFHLEEGTCTALIGPNGAGKTTLLRTITGLYAADQGRIRCTYEGKDLQELIGYLPQYPHFYEWMSGKEFLQFIGKLYNLSTKERNFRVDEALERVGLIFAKDKLISNYSGGMKQRLGLAQAILHRPKILLLDEPVSSLDPIGRREVLQLIESFKAERTIFFATHILKDAEEVSDRVILLKEGKILEDERLEDLKRKYASKKIIARFQEKEQDLSLLFSSLKSIQSFEQHGQEYIFFVSDLEVAREELLECIYLHQLPVTSFQFADITMEEMFMKAVKEQ